MLIRNGVRVKREREKQAEKILSEIHDLEAQHKKFLDHKIGKQLSALRHKLIKLYIYIKLRRP